MMQGFDLEKFRGKRVCVALSGGADSVCLLHSLFQFSDQFQIRLSAIHIEHGIRGEQSIRDMQFCRELCQTLGIPIQIVHAEIVKFAEEQKMGLEEAGRKFRYAQFAALLDHGEADYVATAHHLNDVAETVFFRLARGTSLAGMHAVYGERAGIVRPLLSVTREEIMRYLRENHLSYVEDATNSDEAYTRNYIRHTALPAFEKIAGKAARHLVKFASFAAQDDDYLLLLARREVKESFGERSFRADLPDPLFLRACLICMDAEKDYTAANLEEIRKLKFLQSGKKVCLPKGQMATREYDNIVFYFPTPSLSARPFTENDALPCGNLRADLDCLPKNCVLRTRQEGDYFVPFGGKRKSLKKFFSDRKISARLGKQIPLIADGSEVLIVYGVEISERVKVTEKTVRVGFF